MKRYGTEFCINFISVLICILFSIIIHYLVFVLFSLSCSELPPIGTDTDLAIEQLSEKVTQDLRAISKWLTEYGKSVEFIKTYQAARSTMLSRSLAG